MDFKLSLAGPTCIERPRASSDWTPAYLDSSDATRLETREMTAGLPTRRNLAEIVNRNGNGRPCGEKLHHVVLFEQHLPEFLSLIKLVVVA
jgi:hypothetical protein